MNCKGTTKAGAPCRAPESTVDGSGYCPAHRADSGERMREIARKGGRATAEKHRRAGMKLEDWPLDTLDDAKAILHRITLGVLAKEVDHRDASAATRAVEAWLKANADEVTAQVVQDLREEVKRVKADLAGRKEPWR